ncbi:amino acid adenylation domain-containing protein [Anaeromyxobacter diazotrophicus]|uniref:amino acid adenylation domain-containing protein n=1 Tax=Anaeromyxobacter diazotrophicus TaxID=2590199 RepID=UPI003FCD9606
MARAPEAVAVVAPERGDPDAPTERLAYAALDARANRLAHHLRRRGVRAGEVVAVCLPRGAELVVAVLAALKAGAAYLPVDPTVPRERLGHVLGDARAALVVTDAATAGRLPGGAPRLLVDAEAEEIARQPAGAPGRATAPEDVAYLVYTSGSTGKPKGTVVRHRNLVNAYLGWEQAYRLPELTAHLQMASCGFDVFTGDLARALGSGAKLVLCPREHLLDPARLVALLRAEAIDAAEFVPAVLRSVMQHLAAAGERLAGLKLVVCGSDVWQVGEYRALARLCDPGARVVNSFGLTETTIDSSWFEDRDVALPDERTVPIGRPFANTRLYVLDPAMEPVPVGVAGELYVGGAGVAAGYLHRPELTAERFLPDPFAAESDARLYRTGDRARFLPSGDVEFLGRLDQQVKIRGARVELGEVEAVLRQHPALRDAIVVAAVPPGASRGQPVLAAYVVADAGGPGVAALRAFLQERLPDVMIPAAFVALPALPLTPSGKLDRRGLPPPDWASAELRGRYEPPRTPAEQLLASIWSELLGVERVGRNDGFFDVGGHSLLATQLVSRVRRALGVELPLRAVFETPGLADLAEAIDRLRRAAGGVPVEPIPVVPRAGPLPLSFAQQRLWFLEQLNPGGAAYHIPEVTRVRGVLELALLAQSVAAVIARHEALRTVFPAEGGEPRQVILPSLEVPVPVVDLRARPAEEREREARRLAEEAVRRPFDLAHGPLLRALVVRLADDDQLLVLCTHHIVGDEWSGRVVGRELIAVYEALQAGRAPELPPVPLQYADYAAWQRGWLRGEVLEAQLGWWKRALSPAPPALELPGDRPRPAVQGFRGGCVPFALPADVSERLRALGAREGATPFMAALAAFAVLLHRWSGQEDVCVGTPIANRGRAELEGLVGLLVNTLALRADLSGEPSFREVLRRVREAALGAYAHQDVPFEMVVDAVRPGRSLGHSPLFQVMFVFQSARERAGAAGGLDCSALDVHTGSAKFDLTLFAVDEPDGLKGMFEYDSDLFDAATVARMAEHLQVLTAALVADPDAPVGRAALVPEAERRQVVEGWNATAAPYPRDACAQALVERHAAAAPDAIAVRGSAATLTYGELDRRADQLARRLQRQGVGPGQLVGVCMERAPELLVALLGVWKAGGAYVPLDPGYPRERLAYMLEDAAAPVVLTQGRLAARVAGAGRTVLCLDDEAAALAAEPTGRPACAAVPEDPAYVIYTSGSTGRPKGAVIPHRALVNYLVHCLRCYPLEGGEGAPVQSSISFDLTVTSLFGPLAAGRTVHLVPEAEGIGALADVLVQGRDLSLVKITPAHLAVLAEQVGANRAAGRTRAFIIGGENLLPEHVAFWRRHAPDTALVNEYGPTETTVGCAVYWTPSAGELPPRPVPIGKPIQNTRLYVLDRHLQPAPIGVPGELFIAGAGVGLGYWRRPELTAERFLPDPFHPGERMYRSGDRARWLPDGNLECLGRLDDQVKLRGFRVELGDVEAALAEHASVRSAVAAVKEDGAARRLVAYVVPAQGAELDEAALRAHLAARLPPYMIPAAFVRLAELPLSANGKVDRTALPAPAAAPARRGRAPATPAEVALARIWAEVLNVPEIGVDDDFFALGGDSILSIQIVARAREAGLHLTPRQVFETPTVAGLAATAGTAAVPAAEQGPVVGPIALGPIQRWFLEREPDEPHHFNQSLLFESAVPLARAPLAAALRDLAEHHDALRLRLERTADGWRQRCAPPGEDDAPLRWEDLSALAEAEVRPAIERISAEVQRSLDLARGPIVRATYLDLGPARPGRLLLVVHHLAVDGVSWRFLLEDLERAYQARAAGEVPHLPRKTSAYRDWTAALGRLAASGALDGELAYWEALPPGAPLPVDLGGGTATEEDAASVEVELTPDETRALLQEAPAALGAGVEELLLAAVAHALAGWTGSPVVRLDLEGHGREELPEPLDPSRTVGWFTALYPVAFDLSAAGDVRQALGLVQAALRRVPGHGVGFGVLRYLAPDPAVRARLAAAGPAQVAVDYLGQVDGALTGGPLRPAAEDRGPERSPRTRRLHLVEVDAAVSGGALRVAWSYAPSTHRGETIAAVAAAFLRALRDLAAAARAAPGRPDGSAFGWSPAEVDRILGELAEAEEG